MSLRERAMSAAAGASVDAACAVTHAAALAWWQARAQGHADPRLAPAGLPHGLALAEASAFTMAEAVAFGRDLARLPVADAVAALGRLYTQTLPLSHRAGHGIFYTPPALVGRLLDQAERAGHDWRSGRAMDPSSGGGAFLVAAALRGVPSRDSSRNPTSWCSCTMAARSRASWPRCCDPVGGSAAAACDRGTEAAGAAKRVPVKAPPAV
jgi:hypothetical protein